MPELNIEKVLEFLNDGNSNPQVEYLRKCKDVFYEVSLHTKGARPKFKDLSIENGSDVIPPRWLGKEYQDLFDRYLMTRHPRENLATRNWRYSQYRPFTKAPFGMLNDILRGAIFQDSQYTLTLPNKDDHDYIWGQNFAGKNLIQYFADIILPSIPEDPNGYVVRIPSKPWYEQVKDKIEVEVFFVNVKDVVFAGGQDLIFKRGNYAYWLNDLTIFRFLRSKDAEVYVLEPQGYYTHRLGHFPATIAGGIWNTEGFNDSFFDKAIPAANEFISSYSAEQMIDKEASHPYITQLAEDCTECNGVGKIPIQDHESGGNKLIRCSSCNGKGRISFNPADRWQVYLDDWEKVKDGAVRITNPDVTINKHHRDKNAEIFEMILRSLNLLNIDAAQSGTAKAIDQEKLYTFISAFSNLIFDTIYATICDIIAYRNVRVVNGNIAPFIYDFPLIKPTQFQIKTAADLMLELTEGTKGSIPGFIRKKQVVEFVDKRFSGDDVFLRKTEIIAELDDLFVYTPDELLTLRTTGNVSPTELVFSRKLPTVIDELIREKGVLWFKGVEVEDLKILVDAAMKPYFTSKEFSFIDDNGNSLNDET